MYVVVCFVCYPIVFGVMVLFCFVSYPAVFLHFHYHLPVYLRIHLFCMSPCICCCIGVLCILISVRLYVCAFIYSVCLHVYAVVSVYCVPLYLCACMSVHLSILYVSHVYAVVSVYCVSLYLCACMSVHLCIVCMSVYLCACISGYIGMSVCVFGTSISVYCVSVCQCQLIGVTVCVCTCGYCVTCVRVQVYSFQSGGTFCLQLRFVVHVRRRQCHISSHWSFLWTLHAWRYQKYQQQNGGQLCDGFLCYQWRIPSCLLYYIWYATVIATQFLVVLMMY